VEYEPVQFQKRSAKLWLPESAELYLDFKGRHLHRRHSFSNFLLFPVDTSGADPRAADALIVWAKRLCALNPWSSPESSKPRPKGKSFDTAEICERQA
jgi:hypothetical protein